MIKLKALLSEIAPIQSFTDRGFCKEGPELGDVFIEPAYRESYVVYGDIEEKPRFGAPDYLIGKVIRSTWDSNTFSGHGVETVSRWFSQIAKNRQDRRDYVYIGKMKNIGAYLLKNTFDINDIDRSSKAD